MYYKIASILLNNGQKNGCASDIFIAQPDAYKENLVGKLFVLAEIESQKNEAVKILDFLVNTLDFNFYQNEKVILKEKIESISVESIFESALNKTNKDLADFLNQEKIRISPYAFSVTVFLLYQNELFFSATGKNKNLLVYKEKTVLKSKNREEEELEKIEYKISEVGKPAEPESEALSINKLFTNVINGKIPPGGYFLIVNEALSEYLSNKQLVKIVTTLSPSSAAEQIKNLLGQINSYVSFLGVIIKNTVSANMTGEELKKKTESEISARPYQPEITATEQKTEDILTPAGIINLKKWTKKFNEKPAITAAPAANAGEKKKAFFIKDKIFFKKRVSFLSPKKILAFGKKIFEAAAGAISLFVRAIAVKRKPREAAPTLELGPETSKKTVHPLSFLTAGRIKLLLVIAAVCIVAAYANAVITDKKNRAEEKLRNFNALISLIEKNQNDIDSKLLYGDKTGAKDLVRENKELLGKIPAEEIAKREAVKSLFAKQDEQLEKTRSVIKIYDLKKIADFTNLNGQAQAQNLVWTDGLLYSADASSQAVYKIDLKENIVTAIYGLGNVGTLQYPTIPPSGGDLYYLASSSLFALEKSDKFSAIKINLPSTAGDVGGLFAYSDKLYLLDKKQGQIYRYGQTSEGFTKSVKWLSGQTDLAAAANIFVDGDLYILYKDGRAEKYLKGKKENFSLEATDPPMTDAARFAATAKNFFVFEPAKKRLAAWNEKGEFLAQYIFESLETTKDFAINEKEKKIYVLDGNTVYEMALPENK